MITKPALISSDLSTEWKTFCKYISQQPKEDMKAQLKELTTNDMLLTMFPNFNVLADVCLTIYCFCGAKLLPYENDENTTKKLPKGEQFFLF